MDMNEASAMTEASGVVDDNDRRKNPSPTTSGKATDFPRSATDLADQLRKVTIDAPLRSLLAAFLFGAWVARRR